MEIFSTDDRRSRELINRIFRMPLRDTVVQVRPAAYMRSRGRPTVRVDGRAIPPHGAERISTKMLLDALDADR